MLDRVLIVRAALLALFAAAACSSPRASLSAGSTLATGGARGMVAGTGGAPAGSGGGMIGAGGSGGVPGTGGTPTSGDAGSEAGGPGPSPSAPDAAGPVTRRVELRFIGGGEGTISATDGATAMPLMTCTSSCGFDVTDGTSITVTAKPAASSLLVAMGGACNTTSSSCSVRVDRNLEVTATLERHGSVLWHLSGSSYTGTYGVIPLGSTVLLAGVFSQTLDLGGPTPLTSAGETDAFLAGVGDVDGKWQWQRRFGTADYEGFYAAADVDTLGAYVAGTFSGRTDFGDGAVLSTASYSGALLRVDSLGRVLWAKPAPGAYAIGRGNGRVVTFGSGIGLFDENGNPQGAVINTPASMRAGVIQTDGSYAVGGGTGGSPLTFGGKTYRPTVETSWVASYSPAGQTRWGHVFTQGNATNWVNTNGVASDARGDVYVTGTFTGQVDIGGIISPGSSEEDQFLVKLEGSTGRVLWKKIFATPSQDMLGTVEVAGDSIIFATLFNGTPVDLGGGPVGPGPVIARFDLEGNHLWSTTIPFIAYTITIGPSGAIYIGGNGIAKLRP